MEDPDIEGILDAQGESTLIRSLEDKEKFCRVITRHIIVDAPRSFIEELKGGLRNLHVLDKITKYPEQFRDIFTCENVKPLDAEAVDLLFTVHFAEVGANGRSSQEAAIVYWRDYLQDCECEFSHVFNAYRLKACKSGSPDTLLLVFFST